MPPVSKKKGPVFPKGKSRVTVGPVWRGPCDPGPNGGISQSMLGAFLNCRERFRLKYVEGLKPHDSFSHLKEYGHLWHACEEAMAKGVEWQSGLDSYVQELCRRYPLQRELVDKWQMACRMQFPIYADYWSKHRDVEERTPLMQEQVFDVPYRLPSGRTVRLRGKFDAVDLIGRGKMAGVYLQENKTKGDIDEEQLRRQLTFDLQTMMYLVALNEHRAINSYHKEVGGRYPTKGVRYNVIRRPLSGGRGNIKQKEGSKNVPAETADEYWRRLQQYFIDEPEYWFMRWRVEISPREIQDFERRFLQPILENLCDWYEWVMKMKNDPFAAWQDGSVAGGAIHWQHPFGVYNALNEGGSSDYDNLLATGNSVGLQRKETLFEELK